VGLTCPSTPAQLSALLKKTWRILPSFAKSFFSRADSLRGSGWGRLSPEASSCLDRLGQKNAPQGFVQAFDVRGRGSLGAN